MSKRVYLGGGPYHGSEWEDERPKAQPKQRGRNGKVIESGTNARDWKNMRPRRRSGPMLRVRDAQGRFVR